MAEAMAPGSVIVDIAAERGGNCELTRAGETVVHHGITIVGPVNLPSQAPYHASQMYATNIVNLLKLMVNKEGVLKIDLNDEIIRETLVTHEGKVVHPKVSQSAGHQRAAAQGRQADEPTNLVCTFSCSPRSWASS